LPKSISPPIRRGVALAAHSLDGGGNRIGAVAASRVQARALGVPAGAACLEVARHTWRGADSVTFVRQVFVAGAYELVARFGPAR
jgi:GntR family histidine utilization transcriptional repressor